MPHRSRRGIALVEVLAVLFIIAVLIGLLLPILVQSRQHAVRVVCAGRLRQIHLTAQVWSQDRKPDRQALDAHRWRPELLPLVGDRATVLFCPGDPAANETSLATLAVRDAQMSRSLLLEAGPLVQRRPAGGGAYELLFAENAEASVVDLRLRVEERSDDVAVVTVVSASPQRRLDLVHAPTRTVVKPALGEPGGTPPGSTLNVPQGQASYGMNVAWNDIRGRSDKVAVLDYYRAVADSNADDWSRLDAAERLALERHGGRLNVLWGDGAVTSVDPSDINPRPNSFAARLWRP